MEGKGWVLIGWEWIRVTEGVGYHFSLPLWEWVWIRLGDMGLRLLVEDHIDFESMLWGIVFDIDPGAVYVGVLCGGFACGVLRVI